MKILYITHLTEKNGATTALCNIMRGMLDRGVDIGLIVPNTEGFICDEARRMGIKILCNYPYPWAKIKGQLSLKLWLITQYKIYELIKTFKPDIVHCNTGVIDYPIFGCLLTKTPMVWHLREYINKDFGLTVTGGMKLHNLIMKIPYVHCIAITKGVFDYFSLSKKKDIVIYDGVILGNEKHQIVCDNLYNQPYFLYVGTFTEGKGAHVIFEQFGKVHAIHPEIQIYLACRYDESSDYYTKCWSIAKEKKFEKNIRFLGYRTDVYELMTHAIALIVPSRFEGFGFVTVEAMYNGCLVIGRNTGGTKEQFEKGLTESGSEIGLRFNHDDELPNLMLKAINEDFQDIKKKARSVVMNNYTSKNNVEQIYKYYIDIL